jgi:hypothetical protein
MKARYVKETLQDPESEGKTYTNYSLKPHTIFCCNRFEEYFKRFSGWSYEKGKFVIVDHITYERHSTTAIDFCPFCGEKITYEELH